MTVSRCIAETPSCNLPIVFTSNHHYVRIASVLDLLISILLVSRFIYIFIYFLIAMNNLCYPWIPSTTCRTIISICADDIYSEFVIELHMATVWSRDLQFSHTLPFMPTVHSNGGKYFPSSFSKTDSLLSNLEWQKQKTLNKPEVNVWNYRASISIKILSVTLNKIQFILLNTCKSQIQSAWYSIKLHNLY